MSSIVDQLLPPLHNKTSPLELPHDSTSVLSNSTEEDATLEAGEGPSLSRTVRTIVVTPDCSSNDPECLAPRQCQLCGFKYHVALGSPPTSANNAATYNGTNDNAQSSPIECSVPAGVFRCNRCGLSTSYSAASSSDGKSIELNMTPLEQASLQEAARAYRFVLLSETSPLLKELAQIVVDYLIWYRGPQDFKAGDLVDARDLRGNWHLARVEAVAHSKVLVHFLGFTSKWDAWMSAQSDALAPCHTKTKGVQNAFTKRLAERIKWSQQSSANNSPALTPHAPTNGLHATHERSNSNSHLTLDPPVRRPSHESDTSIRTHSLSTYSSASSSSSAPTELDSSSSSISSLPGSASSASSASSSSSSSSASFASASSSATTAPHVQPDYSKLNRPPPAI